jgi:hypothetical protein
MFLTVFAACAKAFLTASSQLFGEVPINSIIFTTVIYFCLQHNYQSNQRIRICVATKKIQQVSPTDFCFSQFPCL